MSLFVDELTVHVRAGKGGNGIVSFYREKFMPKGGPDGGDGGKGGDVVIVSSSSVTTLGHLKLRKLYSAFDGENGRGKNQSGKGGKGCELRVPVGTVVMTLDGEILFDFTEEGQKFIAATGGKGGAGNQHFATSVNQTPRRCTPGREGGEGELLLQLKVIADIGLVGFPNAGKSTFLAAVTKSNPKIAPYPFTTLHPNLGTFSWDGIKYYVIADIPGIIEGASEGKGLGIKFLKHIERTRILLVILDGTGSDYKTQYETLMSECEKYSPEITRKKRVVAVSKSDVDGVSERFAEFKPSGEEPLLFSSFTKETLSELLKKLSGLCDAGNKGVL